MKRPKYSLSRQNHIDDTRKRLTDKIEKLQRGLTSDLFDLISDLDIRDGKIRDTTANHSKIAKGIKEIEKKYKKDLKDDVIKAFIDALLKTCKLNTKYFNDINPEKTKANEKRVHDLRLKSLGYNEKKDEIVKGSILSGILESNTVINSIRSIMVGAVGALSIDLIKRALRRIVIGEPKKKRPGKVDKEISNVLERELVKHDRKIQKDFAVILELKYFIFQGPLLKTSRKWCKGKKGKVFSVVEAERDWPNEEWDGKNFPYVPLEDIGGYGCVDMIDYISQEEANRRDPRFKLVT